MNTFIIEEYHEVINIWVIRQWLVGIKADQELVDQELAASDELVAEIEALGGKL